MCLKNCVITAFFIGISFLSFSQYKYSFEVESLNNKSPKEVLKDFSQHIEENNARIEEGVFFLESKISYTENNFKEIAAATGYTLRKFEIISKGEEE